jgi:hypothetical protein
MEWQRSGYPRPAPKNSKSKICWKISRLVFFGIKTASSLLIIFQRAKVSTRSITYLCWSNWRIFWRKNAVWRSTSWSCSCMTIPCLPGHLQPRINWPTWVFIVFSGSDPVGLPPVSWTQKTIERSPFFVRHRGHCCREDVVGLTTFRISVSGLQTLQQRAKKYIELRGDYIE